MTASDWVALTAAIVAAVAIFVSWRGARSQQQTSKHALEEQRLTSEAAINAQRELAAEERIWAQRADVYAALLQWARAVRSTRHLDQQDRERIERIPADVVARANAFASKAVQEQLALMTKMRDSDSASLGAPNDVVASGRRSGHLRIMANELQEIIRGELGASD